jgi:tRNA-specific 2-thiouridylase
MQQHMKQKVALGLSGGVDSSVAAALLIAQGYEVTGVYIEAYNEPGCRTDQDKKDALRVALQLGMPFMVLDVRQEYSECVIEYFYDEYKAGRTPNPDVVCNREIKFGIFYNKMVAQGFDYVATGHYARVAKIQHLEGQTSKDYLQGLTLIQRARDLSKDQSYFLWQVAPEKLEHVLFPLGELTKKEVRGKAKELGLPTASKPDSMGICFVGEVNVAKMLAKKLGEKLGQVLMNGIVVGAHKGIWTVTLGQKAGQEISLDNKAMKIVGMDTTKLPGLFVVGKDKAKNQIVIGKREECYRSSFGINNNQSSINKPTFAKAMVGTAIKLQGLINDQKLFVRIRNLGELSQVIGIRDKGVGVEIETAEPVFAPAEGQMAVLYARLDNNEGNEVIVAGGEIVYI